MSGLTVWAQAPGIAAPGLQGWAQARAVLGGAQAYTPAEMPKYAPNLLPPNERRRAGLVQNGRPEIATLARRFPADSPRPAFGRAESFFDQGDL